MATITSTGKELDPKPKLASEYPEGTLLISDTGVLALRTSKHIVRFWSGDFASRAYVHNISDSFLRYLPAPANAEVLIRP